MNHLNLIKNKIYCLSDLQKQIKQWKLAGEKIVFTNGCFDILHKGHVEVLAKTSNFGSRLIVGLNSDHSIKKLKGKNRPIIQEDSRALLLASLQFVDAVVLFPEETPFQLISKVIPDVLAKGGDYKIKEIVGHEVVQKSGGEVIIIPLTEGFSSSNIIDKIQNG